jgi:predicted nuclease of predicted toxin-antitoxin system
VAPSGRARRGACARAGVVGRDDSSLVALAISEERVLITADLDYPRLIALSNLDRPALILFRAGNITDNQMLALLQRVLREVESSLLERSISVVDEYSIRVASLPLKSRD